MKEIFLVPDKLKSMLAVLERQQALLEAAQTAEPVSQEGRPWIDPKLNKAVSELAGAYSTLAREYRNWLGHVKTNLDALSLGRKIQVMVQFTQDLALGNRRDLYEALARLESERPDGIKLNLTAPAQEASRE